MLKKNQYPWIQIIYQEERVVHVRAEPLASIHPFIHPSIKSTNA